MHLRYGKLQRSEERRVGKEWYNYNDPACKSWSNVCDGSFKISNIRVIAEDEI